LAHVSIRTRNLEASRKFYCDVLGLRVGYRPPFPFPGLWLYDDGDDAVIHLIAQAEGADGYLGARAGLGAGAFDHVALATDDADALRTRLSANDIGYQERLVPELEQRQLFVRDPNGVVVEFIFPGGSSPDR